MTPFKPLPPRPSSTATATTHPAPGAGHPGPAGYLLGALLVVVAVAVITGARYRGGHR